MLTGSPPFWPRIAITIISLVDTGLPVSTYLFAIMMNLQGHMEPYSYEPLDVSKGQIRLVELLPGDGPVCAKHHLFPLAEAPPFDALSYTLGTIGGENSVMFNGAMIKVSDDLLAFLQSIRQCPCVPLLWVDAISINWNDSEERGHSIRIMPAIYRKATRTLCWTGLEYHSSLRELITKTRQVGKHEEVIAECLSGVDILHSTYKIRQSDIEVFHAAMTLIDIKTWRNIDTFFNQTYFNIIFSRNPIIFDGGDGISWGQLSQALLAWSLFSPNSVLQSPATMFVLLSESMRRKYYGLYGTPITIPDILLALRSCQVLATNAKDYVYAAYSIGKGMYPEENIHEVDYRLDLNVVFAQASLDLNELSNQPLSLSLVDHPTLHFPSWTPDWETRSKRFLLNHPASSFTASTHTDPKRFSGRDSDLGFMCMGLVVDIIRDTNEYMPQRRDCDHYKVSGDNSFFFAEWLEFAKEKSDITRADEEVLLDYADTIQARGCNHIWEHPVSSTQDRLREIRDFLDFLENPDAEEKNSIRLFYAACLPSHDRRFAITRNKHFCLVPKATKRGDLVCIPHGSRVPYIFRCRKDGSGYQNIGETYVHDMMHGEANNAEGLEEKDFCLR